MKQYNKSESMRIDNKHEYILINKSIIIIDNHMKFYGIKLLSFTMHTGKLLIHEKDVKKRKKNFHLFRDLSYN